MQLLLLFFFALASAVGVDDPPWTLIQERGYPCEQHQIDTVDGYALSVQRIPKPGAPVVYLQHGLLDSSATWVMNGPSDALGFVLSDAGFDVWMGNQRGNRYSNTMTNGSDFNWSFSMDEMARYDDEALLTFIGNNTGKLISWIGHSRGTQQMFYGLSAYPHHANYLNLFIALAPVCWVGKMEATMLRFLADVDTRNFFADFDYNDFLPSGYDIEDFCIIPGVNLFCKDLMSSIVGPGVTNATLFDQDNLELWLHHFPAGTSSQEMAHYAQLVKNDNVAMYNFGSSAKNMEHYGTDSPPEYNISKLSQGSLPIALFSGGEDVLADPADVLRFITTVGADRFVSIVDIPYANHMWPIWGLDAPTVIWNQVISLLKSHA